MNTFPLLILTPEREFFNGEAISVTMETIGGRISVLAGHIPMVSALSVGMLLIRTPEKDLLAAHSEGYIEVTRGRVAIFSQACEWPEEIDTARAMAALERASKRLEAEHPEQGRAKMAILRARRRLEVEERVRQMGTNFGGKKK